MSRADDEDDFDAPPPTQGTLTSAEATRLLFRDPGVRNYLFASLGCTIVGIGLINMGPVEVAPTFNNAFVLNAMRDELTVGARATIGA